MSLINSRESMKQETKNRWDKQKTKSKMKGLNVALLLENRMDIWLKKRFSDG